MFNKYGWVRGSRLPLTQSVVLNCGGALSQHKGVYARLRGRWGEGASTNAAALGHAASRSDAVRLKLPEQPAEALDLVIDAAASQRVPYDRLVRRHHVDAELLLQRIDREGGRPVR